MGKKKNIVKPPSKIFLSTKEWFSTKQNDSQKNFIEFVDIDTVFHVIPKTKDDKIHWKFKIELENTHPPAFIAVLREGRVCGNGAIITKDNSLLWDVSLEYGIKPENHSIFKKKKLPTLKHTEEVIAVLTFSASDYYYHWMFDVLSRIFLLKKSGISFDRAIINKNDNLPFQEETLSILGIKSKEIISTQQDIHIASKKLVVPSLVGYTGHMPKWACTFLRKIFLNNSNTQTTNSKGDKRIYISRKYARHRKVLNEDEVFSVLEPFGFKNVVLEKMKVSEQVQLFSNADIIIGPHGGGLTNLVFCKPGTKVIEFFSPDYVNVLYWILCNHVDLDYYYLIGNGESPPEYTDPHRVGEDITINCDSLKYLLKSIDF